MKTNRNVFWDGAGGVLLVIGFHALLAWSRTHWHSSGQGTLPSQKGDAPYEQMEKLSADLGRRLENDRLAQKKHATLDAFLKSLPATQADNRDNPFLRVTSPLPAGSPAVH